MNPHLDLIVSCTERKRVPTERALRLGSVPAGSLQERFRAWSLARDRSQAERIEADQLYKGDHWVVALDLKRLAVEAGFDTTLWIASAGWGLIRSTAALVSYGATFASRAPDSVDAHEPATSRRSTLQTWWTLLTRVEPSTSLTVLAKRRPKGHFLVVAGPAYLQAMEADLVQMHAVLGGSERVALVAGAARFDAPELQDWLLCPPARLSHTVGGSLSSLHVRTARALLTGRPPEQFNQPALRRSLERLTTDAPAWLPPDRTPMTDEEVRRYIRTRLRRDAKASFTRLLREFRSSGKACEHKRFRSLFGEEQHANG